MTWLKTGLALLAFAVFSFQLISYGVAEQPYDPYAEQPLKNPAQENQAQDLMHTLRCLVCQGQSIADSNAAMAADMRAIVRHDIEKGWSPEQVRRWFIDRYGDWVSYKPTWSKRSWPLWILPLVILSGGIFLITRLFKREEKP
ncbi:MAG: cytochrome c-type biogenesis protein [Zymomonas mobilis]|uniref:Cytochrome c-type biogenesis protein n=1 Tax=Zymomonas mobilis TaxID=542 RepID=A0A542W206_ZYMMB|nr:cytochrome c-type biogenesis protein [Zymomonas mobilis]TQL17621.1 cytochrome c-type biogenesis protein CcmH [Zymomonas mobilis]